MYGRASDLIIVIISKTRRGRIQPLPLIHMHIFFLPCINCCPAQKEDLHDNRHRDVNKHQSHQTLVMQRRPQDTEWVSIPGLPERRGSRVSLPSMSPGRAALCSACTCTTAAELHSPWIPASHNRATQSKVYEVQRVHMSVQVMRRAVNKVRRYLHAPRAAPLKLQVKKDELPRRQANKQGSVSQPCTGAADEVQLKALCSGRSHRRRRRSILYAQTCHFYIVSCTVTSNSLLLLASSSHLIYTGQLYDHGHD